MKIHDKISFFSLRFLTVLLLSSVMSTFTLADEGKSLSVDDLPAEFQALYQFHPKNVELHFADQDGVHLRVEANYNTIRLRDPQELAVLTEKLLAYHIAPKLIEQLKDNLFVGVQNTDQCQGVASSCLVSPDTYATLFDYYTNKVYLWINPSYIKYSAATEQEFAPAIKKNHSLINHFSTYASSNNGLDNYSLNFYDDSIIGLRHGYIDNRITYNTSSNDNDFDLDRSQYNYEFNKYRFRAGYNATIDDFNSTDFLINVNNTAELAVDFGTSYNLIKSQTRETQKIFFFAPKSGVLKVYRDNRIILQRNIGGGQGYITNQDLPRGRYNVILEVTVGDQIISQESHAIFNTSDDTLEVGGFDYRFTAGVFQATDSYSDGSIEYNVQQEMDNQAFGRGLMSYRATDRLLVSSGLISSQQGNSLALGAKLYLPLDATLELKSNLFEENAYQLESYITLGNLNFSFEQYDNGTDKPEDVNALATYYYGAGSYKRYNASYSSSLPFWNMYGYVSYSYTQQENTYNSNQPTDFDDFKINVLAGGVRFPFIIDSTVDISMNYNFSQGNNDSYYATLTWSIPINQIFSIRSTVSADDNGLSQFANSIETSDLLRNSDDYYLSANVTNNYTPQAVGSSTYASSSLNAQVNKDTFNASGYVYGDTNGSSSGNLSFTSSQIITANGISATSKRSDAYVRIKAENNIREDAQNSSRGLLVVEKNGRYANKQSLYEDTEVLPLNTYDDYQVSLDVESTDLYNSGNSRAREFTQPGSVLEMNTKISRIVTFVSGFKDIFDRDISEMQCVGDGCLNVKEMVKGVYKVSVLEGMSFGLKSGTNNCFLPKQTDGSHLNFGSNYCLPNLASTASMSITVDNKSMTLTYLGSYKRDQNFREVESELNLIVQRTPEIEIRRKEVANTVFVYAISKEGYALSASLKEKISELQRYAIKLEKSSIGDYALHRQ